ncbi:MAG TPA: hypothetical protein VE954_19780 [Oligoflexus sp.]|uniref:mevalonate kinase family protein n=1 Tax=Oligoflexus sp. TaxID=1971216 RepID=UPI002D618293|nr:hypothetical protein [Oligoflexus sp.]HYX35343.1 hypothetical protein [Oligoflexus sp.]
MKSVSIQVPGKILLAGEYAVLDGYPALSMAVDRYLTVTLTETQHGGWVLDSDLWSTPRNLRDATLDDVAREPLLQVADYAQHHYSLPHIHCRIASDLDIRFGLGSSTALRLGVLLGATALQKDRPTLSPSEILEAATLAFHMQRVQQSFASGYDVLTQALGGVLVWTPDYQNWPGQSWQRMDPAPLAQYLQIFVGGTGAPTTKVGGSVRKALQEFSLQREYNEASNKVITSWLQMWSHGIDTLPQLCHDIAAQRRLFAKLPYFPEHLFQALETLPGFDQTWSAKTTGAGGEDAILLIGTREQTNMAVERLDREGWYQLPVHPAEGGAGLHPGTIL